MATGRLTITNTQASGPAVRVRQLLGLWLKHDMQLVQHAANEASAGLLEVESVHSALPKALLPHGMR